MDDFFELAAGIGFLVSMFSLLIGWFFVRRMKLLPRKSNTELEELVRSSTQPSLVTAAILELHSRGADVAFALPRLSKMLISDRKIIRFVAWSTLQDAFPHVAARVDYNWRKPSPAARAFFEALASGRSESSG